jgi:hypothetical protein
VAIIEPTAIAAPVRGSIDKIGVMRVEFIILLGFDFFPQYRDFRDCFSGKFLYC